MSQKLLPAPAAIERLLGGLVGRPVTVKPATPTSKPMAPACLVANYTDGEGAVRALFVFDLPAAAALGAALPMFPAPVAQEAVRKGHLEEGLFDSFHEICNVMSRLAGGEEGAPLTLSELTPQLVNKPRDLEKLLPGAGARADFEIAVSGYAEGRLSALYA